MPHRRGLGGFLIPQSAQPARLPLAAIVATIARHVGVVCGRIFVGIGEVL